MFCHYCKCPAMKQAIPIAFPESKHRLCMWHITEKFPKRVSVRIAHETTFVSDMKKLVWDMHVEPLEFEKRWNELIDNNGLRGESWWEEMFRIRESWIPTYYKDTFMSGLMKTTSRSESINAFFNVYHAFYDDLVLFLRSFDDAIESQRKTHASNEVTTKYTTPRLVSPSKLEIHAQKVYTCAIFFDVQKELRKALFFCVWDRFEDEDGKFFYYISHMNKDAQMKKQYKVIQDFVADTIVCSCNMFTHNDILCRHALKVLLNDNAQQIPDKYVMHRWRCDIIPIEWLPARVHYGEIDVEKERRIGRVFYLVDSMLDRVRNDNEAFDKFLGNLERMNEEYEACESSRSKLQ